MWLVFWSGWQQEFFWVILLGNKAMLFQCPLNSINFKAEIRFHCIACHQPECTGIHLLLSGLLRPFKTKPLKALSCQLKWMLCRKASSALLSMCLVMSSRYHTLLFPFFLSFVIDKFCSRTFVQKKKKKVESNTEKKTQ